MGSSGDEAEETAEVLRETMDQLGEQGLKHPYSLTSKFLHFCLPQTYAIYDQQAVSSVQTWSRHAFDKTSPADKRQSQFFRFNWLSDTSATGYRWILAFYRFLWACSTSDEQVHLKQAAKALQEELSRQSDQDTAQVSVLDVIDKLLWLADGDPARLGLDEQQESA